MTEADWLAGKEPGPMLEFLRERASDRRLRLLTVACLRAGWWASLSAPQRQSVEVSERYAGGLAAGAERHAAGGGLNDLKLRALDEGDFEAASLHWACGVALLAELAN